MNSLAKTFFLPILFLVACSEEEMAIDYNQEVNMNIGDKIIFPDQNYLILNGASDGRCCCKCQCIIPGLISFAFEAKIGDEIIEFVWNDDSDIVPNKTPFENYEIELIDTRPSDNCDESIKLEKYVFAFKFVK